MAVEPLRTVRDCMDAISFALHGDPNDYGSDTVTLDVSVVPDT